MSHTVTIATDRGEEYPVLIGDGVSDRSSELLPKGCTAVALISDSNLSQLHRSRIVGALGERVSVAPLDFPAGEASKTRATKQQLEDAMLAAGLGRDCAVLALGGGVTTDLAGFVAGTFLRGVPWIAVPTSLLAAVDAGVGGKVGVNAAAGKNLFGMFHQPLGVLIDLRLLTTLPPPEIDNGLAEMVKHAVIADPQYLERLEGDVDRLRALEPDALAEPIRRSVEIKSEVVAADTEERDLRQVLNLGHTIGHAIEAVSEFSIGHGLAVAAGLAVECGIACRLGLMESDDRDLVRDALDRLGLPTAPPDGLEPAALLEATKLDKKGRRGRPRYALPAAVGRMARGEQGFAREVPDDVVLAAIAGD